MTGRQWVVGVRTFYSDVCTWATEPGSPFAGLVPPAVPLDRRDLRERGALSSKQQVAARMTAVVLDLEREMPHLRAFALRRWHEASEVASASPGDGKARQAQRRAFWDWALLELLVTSGLRVEEACELTTLDVLRRQLADGSLYYLLHVKPSKFGSARVIPIGDVLGRVLAEIIRSVKAFYGTEAVPFVDRRDHNEKLPLPRAPYLLQGFGHPSAFGVNTIRWRLAELSKAAELRCADGSPLVLRPHDCRRMFASEQLNNNTPVHVIAMLLGHATLDTVMIYAKLYPSSLVEGYRKAMRGVYTDVYGNDAIRPPNAEEWETFSASCSLRDMGTHVCALPTGEHCSRALVCLGCGHAQPKRSALSVFARMLASHERALVRAKDQGEPAGQVAARELEVERIRSAMRRAGELTEGVAEALEAV
jgi:integrase